MSSLSRSLESSSPHAIDQGASAFKGRSLAVFPPTIRLERLSKLHFKGSFHGGHPVIKRQMFDSHSNMPVFFLNGFREIHVARGGGECGDSCGKRVLGETPQSVSSRRIIALPRNAKHSPPPRSSRKMSRNRVLHNPAICLNNFCMKNQWKRST